MFDNLCFHLIFFSECQSPKMHIDHFGLDVQAEIVDDTHFRAKVLVCTNPTALKDKNFTPDTRKACRKEK